MTNDIIKDLNLEPLKILEQYRIDFGIFPEDGSKEVTVNVLNLDDTLSHVDMSIADVMYFTENGTISIPGKHILEKCLQYSHYQLDLLLDDIVYEILTNNANENAVVLLLNEFVLKFEAYIKSVFQTYTEKQNVLGALLEQTDENKYLYDLDNLSKYLKCKLVKIM